MNRSQLDKLAEDVMDAHVAFHRHLNEKGPFPTDLFRAFFNAVVQYADAATDKPMIHRSVTSVVNGLREFLELKSFRTPGKVIADADRMESMLFGGYDPHFDGNEPPGL
ncbi:hypothetical protein ACFL6C_05345 [Myxococcota bacterium]